MFEKVEHPKDGERNVRTFKLAAWARKTFTEKEWNEKVRGELREWAMRAPNALPESEIEAVLRSAERYPPNTDQEIKGAKAAADFLINEEPPPFFPVSVLPPVIGQAVMEVARAAQVPVDLPAMLALGVMAAATAKTAIVCPQSGWFEPLNVFVCCVMPPGSRKSAVFRAMLAPLIEYEKKLVEAYQRNLPEVETKARWLESQQTKTWQKIERGEGDPDELHQEAVMRASELKEAAVPKAPRLVADDVTPERVATLLQENSGRICIASPEADVFEIMRGRYSKAANLGVFLKGHAGDDIRVDRMSRAAECVSKPALTIVLAVQPRALEDLDASGEMRGRGMTARFLFSLPPSNVGKRAASVPSADPKVMQAYAELIMRLAGRPVEAAPPVIGLESEAQDLFRAFMEELERDLGEGGALSAVVDWGSKLAGAVLRMAGNFALARAPGAREVLITWKELVSAIDVGKYLVEHAQLAQRMMRGDVLKSASARRVLARIFAMESREFDTRQVYRGVYRHMNTKETKQLLNALVDRGWLARLNPNEREERYQLALPQSVCEKLIGEKTCS